VTCRPIATERIGKQAHNKYATNNRGRPVLGNGRVFYGSASRLYQNRIIREWSESSAVKEEGFG
jgi:hypothetical protein